MKSGPPWPWVPPPLRRAVRRSVRFPKPLRSASAACLPLATLLLTLSGCIEISQTLTINDNGSGTLEVDYAIGDQNARRLATLDGTARKIAADRGIALRRDTLLERVLSPEAEDIRALLASYATAGIHLQRYSFNLRNARRELSFALAFDDLAQVAKTDFFPRYGFSLTPESPGRYRFSTGPWVTNSPIKAVDLTSPEAAAVVHPLLAGFHVTMTLRPPGRVIDGNAQRLTPVSAEWVYDINEDPEAIFKLQESGLWCVFEFSRAPLPTIRQDRPAPPAQP